MSYAVCTVSAAPMRKEPSHRSEMTSQLLFGDVVRVGEAKEEWYRITCLYDGYEGWVTHHLITQLHNRIADTSLAFVSTGLTNAVRYRGELFQIPMGCTLPGYNETSRALWTADYTFDGTCRNTGAPRTRELFENTIRLWMNAPYLWGGKTFLGVDCSGFVQTVFKLLGVPLLRDAYQQAGQGKTVDFENRQRGDVAFFSNEAGRITHVGIVLKEGRIVHASGKVRIDTLTSEGILTTGEKKQTHVYHSLKRMTDFAD